jgi:hypothetical protein
MINPKVYSTLVVSLILWEIALLTAPVTWIWAVPQAQEVSCKDYLLHLSTATRVGPIFALMIPRRYIQVTIQKQLDWGLCIWSIVHLSVVLSTIHSRLFTLSAFSLQVVQYVVIIWTKVYSVNRLHLGTRTAVKWFLIQNRTWWGWGFSVCSFLGPTVGLLYLLFPRETFQPSMLRYASCSIMTHMMRLVGCNLLFSNSVFLCLKFADNHQKSHTHIRMILTLITIFIGAYEFIIFSTCGAAPEAIRELFMTAVMTGYLARQMWFT